MQTLEAIGDHLAAAHELARAAAELAIDLPVSSARLVLPWMMQVETTNGAAAASIEREIQFRDNCVAPEPAHRSDSETA